MHGKGQTGHGLTLLIRANFGLCHHVDDAEGEQNRKRNHAVGASIQQGRAPEQQQPNDGANPVEHGVASDESQGCDLRGQRSGRIRQLDVVLGLRGRSEQGPVVVHDSHRGTDKAGDDTAPSPCIGIGDRLEGGTQSKPDVERDEQGAKHVGQHLAVVGVPEVRDEEQTAQGRSPVAIRDGRKQTEHEPDAHGQEDQRGFGLVTFVGEHTGQAEAHLYENDQTDEGRIGSVVVIHQVIRNVGGGGVEQLAKDAVGKPPITLEHIDDGEQGQNPVESILHGAPGHEGQDRQEEHATRGVQHAQQNEHQVGHGVAGPVQTVRIKSSAGDDDVGDQRSADQNKVEQEGGGVDAFSAAPKVRTERKGKRRSDEDQQGHRRGSCGGTDGVHVDHFANQHADGQRHEQDEVGLVRPRRCFDAAHGEGEQHQ